MNFNRSRGAALLMAVLMVLSVMAGGALAALTYDNETTKTASTSDWQDGTAVSDLDNSSKVSTVEVQSDNATDGESFTLRMVVNDSNSAQDGQTIYEDTSNWTATNSTAGYYEQNVTHGEAFEDLERGANETVTVDVKTIWNESETDEESATISIDAQNDDNPRLVVDDRATIESTGITVPVAGLTLFEGDADAAQQESNISVNNNTTTLTVHANSKNVSDAMDAATADTSSGDLTPDAYVKVNDQLVPVFDQSADAEWLDNGTETYAVANGDTVTVENVNETYDSGTTSVDVVVGANADVGFWETHSMLRDYGASRSAAAQAAIGAGPGSTFDGA